MMHGTSISSPSSGSSLQMLTELDAVRTVNDDVGHGPAVGILTKLADTDHLKFLVVNDNVVIFVFGNKVDVFIRS
jgi:hypothetical protein